MIKPVSKTKLTLWVPKDIKHFAREWSRGHQQSLSELFTNYLKQLKKKEDPSEEISPLIKELTGVIPHTKEVVQSYQKHLRKKYLHA